MRKNLNRTIACVLAVALLITCSLSGLVLSAIAGESESGNLLAGKLAASYTVKPGTSAFPEAKDVALVSGERYAMRFEAKGSNGFVSFTDGNNAWRRENVKDTGDNWRAYQIVFTANGASGNFAGQIKNEGATNDLVVRNIELYKAPKDGTFNIVPGGDMDTQTEFFGRQFDGANGGPQIVADPDDPSNSVMRFPKTSETTYATRYTDLSNITAFDANMVYKFTFRMKGQLRITSYVTNPTYLPNPDAISITGSGRHTYYKSDEWATFSFYIKIGADPNYLEFWNTTTIGGTADLWLDDLQIYEMPAPSALAMSSEELGIYPGNSSQLSVTTTPEKAYVKDGDIVWSSSDPDVVSVDQKGNVKAATTAAFGKIVTITAKYSDTVKATCTVTIDENAPKPPAYTTPNTNGYEGVDTNRTLNSGGEPVEIKANALLKANTRYAVRYTAKSTAAGALISHNGSSVTDSIPVSTEWQVNQFLFVSDSAGAVFKLTVTPSVEAGSTVEIKDVELWEAPSDGSFNLIPGSSFDVKTDALASNFAAGASITTDPDDPTNNVMLFPKGNDVKDYWSIKNVMASNMLTSKMFKITFKYKGHIQFNNWTDGKIISWGEDAKVGYGGTGVRNLQYYSKEWTETTVLYDFVNYGNMHYMDFQHAIWYQGGNNYDAFVDDFCIYEVPAATGLQMNQDTLNIYPTDVRPLTVSGVPQNSYLNETRVTWKSSDESVATVDAYGNVTAVSDVDGATATITAMLDGVDATTCLVTIDYDAPKPPIETTPGVNAMEGTQAATLSAGQKLELVPGAILKVGTRYVLRFTAKTNVAGVVFTTNAGSIPFTLKQTQVCVGQDEDGKSIMEPTVEWAANQIMFTPSERISSLRVIVDVPDTDGAQVEIKDWELYEAPKDGTFNLIPGSDSNVQSAFLQKFYAGHNTKNDGISVPVVPMADPDDASNTILQFPKAGTRTMFDMSAIGTFTAGKVWKLTFRMKGNFRIENWGSGAVYAHQPDAHDVVNKGQYVYFASEDWKTVSYYIKPQPSQMQYIQLCNKNTSGGNVESYIDDIQLYEVEGSTALSIVEQDLHLYPTSTQKLTYTWAPADSVLLGGDVTWESNDTGVVIVDAKTGRITVVGDVGQTAVITAKNDLHTAQTTITVDDTVEHAPPVTSITLRAPLGQDMDIGQQSQLMLVGDPIDNLVGRATWKSSDSRIVSVDAKGNIVALGAGTATITGTTEFNMSASITITVYPTANMLDNGDFEQGKAVSWKNSSRVQDGKGQYGSVGYVIQGESSTFYGKDIVFKPATKYQISYRYKAEKGANFRLYTGWVGASNVKPSKFVEPGTIDEAEWEYVSVVFTTTDFFDIELGYAFSLTTSECDNEGDHLYAYIDNVRICEYLVGDPVETLTIEQQNVTIAPGRSTKLTVKATPDPADTNMITWTSSDEQVAYVVSGNVYGVGAGTATITATAKNGVSATTTVTVNGAPALLYNGTFEVEDDPVTEEDERVWVLNDKAYYEPGYGVGRSNTIRMTAGGMFSQTFKGLKPDTAYQVVFRHVQRDSAAKLAMKITDSKGGVVAEGEGGLKQVVFKSSTFKFDFITPADLVEGDEYTLEFSFAEGGEYVRIDQIMIVEAASEVDLIVSDITWSQDNADQVVPGTELEFFVSVVNQGSEAYPGTKPFYIDILVDAQKVKTLEYHGQIAVGEMLIVKSKANDAWVTTAGDHMITAVVNSTMTILESDDSNNHYTVNLRVANEEDFVVAPEGALEMGHNRLIFSDHFTNNLTIDHTASGNPGYKWYITRPWGEATLTPNDYRVEDGVLYLTTHQTAWNYSMCTVDAKHPGIGFSFNTGYMEIRVRMKETAEDGSVEQIRVPAVWAFSDETIWGTRPEGKDSLELDWIEYWGDKYGEPRFDTTLHHTIVGKDGQDSGKVTTGQRHYEPIGDYQWHTYAMGWNEGILKTYFDGKLIGTQKYSKDDYPDPMPTGSINIDAGSADPAVGLFSILDEQNMPIILGGASDFPLEVDWIHVWQSDGSIDPVDENELIAQDFVNTYLTEDNGQVVTEITLENFEKILAGEQAFSKLTADQQALVNNTLGMDYLSLVVEIRNTITLVENFVLFYACAEDGTPYTIVDATNYEWIAGAQAEWDTLSDFAKALIDKTVAEYSGMTFTDMLAQAQAYQPEAAPQEETVTKKKKVVKTDLTILWIVLGVLGGVIVIGGVVIVLLLFVKKKKKNANTPQ